MPPADLLQGTLDLLILKALQLGPLHGLGVARRVEQMTQGAFQVGPGSLFPALHRLEGKGWLSSQWGVSQNNRRAKFYTLTRAGKRQFQSAVESWSRISAAINLSLETS